MDKISWDDFKKLFDTKRDRNIICPGCKKSNKDGKFATFIDGSPGDGKCFSCDYFQYKGLNRMSSFVSSRPDIKYNYIPSEVVNSSRLSVDSSTPLTNYLLKYFDKNKVKNVLDKYYICTGPKYNSIAFPLIDTNRNIRRIQYMKFYFDGIKCKRTNYNNWYEVKNGYDRCLFGEHWLTDDKDSEICVLESQRACLYMKCYDYDKIWLGTGGKSNLHDFMFAKMQYREIRLIPDVDGLELWSKRAEELQKKYPTNNFYIDDICYLNMGKIGPNGDIEDLMLTIFAQH